MNKWKRYARGCALCLPLSLLLTAGSGCASVTGLFSSKVVMVDPSNDVFKVGPKTRGYVYYQNAKGEWVRSANKVNLPEGWLVGKP